MLKASINLKKPKKLTVAYAYAKVYGKLERKTTYINSIYIYLFRYSGVQIRWQRVFWAENQGNHQNFDTSLLTYKC